MSQNGTASGGSLELGKGLPTTLARGINPAFTTYDLDAIFHLETGMPISEFRDRFEGVEKRLDTIVTAIKDNANKASDRDDELHSLIFGGMNYKGVLSRLESLEGDRDRQKNRVNLVVGGFIALVVAVASGAIPALVHGLIKLVQ